MSLVTVLQSTTSTTLVHSGLIKYGMEYYKRRSVSETQVPDTCNIATTLAIRCAGTGGLAYRYVAYLAAAFLVFFRCHPRRWSKTVTVQVGRYSQPSSRTACITNARLTTVQPSSRARIIGPVVLPEAQFYVNGLTLTGPTRSENQ